MRCPMNVEEAVFKVIEYAHKLDSRIIIKEGEERLLERLCKEVLKITDRDARRLLRKSTERLDPITGEPYNNAKYKKRLFQNENFIKGIDNIKVDPLTNITKLERIADIYGATMDSPLKALTSFENYSLEVMTVKGTLRGLLQ